MSCAAVSEEGSDRWADFARTGASILTGVDFIPCDFSFSNLNMCLAYIETQIFLEMLSYCLATAKCDEVPVVCTS